jgi:NADH-quinone oxidoreductase subunit L
MGFTLIQHGMLSAAVLAPALPFLAFALILLRVHSRPGLSAGFSIAAVTLSCGMAFYLLLWPDQGSRPLIFATRWWVSGSLSLSFGFMLDSLSLLMLCLVAVISLLVQIFSLGYMRGDPGISRYYAFQSLFAGAMMGLTLSSSLLQLYFFWELVGLCSYLLIGFWYEKFSATEAGKKAFVMTRLGDMAFFLGLLLLLAHLENLDLPQINGPEAALRLNPALITGVSLLIFGGIAGKSAQFPLFTWLPDAMEGPTPVSALLHSATMVAAGVFLMARLFPFFSHSGTALTVILAVGTLTMLMSSSMALVERDIKKIWAYSTISQLGYMIMALAAGDAFAGVFHLTTHAVFKALLFLCAGVWIHYYETNDLFEIGQRAGRRLKIPLICLIVAAASLSGIPPLAGFFSKEAVLTALARLSNPTWLIAGLTGVFLTGYYTFRVIFILLFPREPVAGKALKKIGGPSYWAMALPLLILAGLTLLLGFGEHRLGIFLLQRPGPDTSSPWITVLSLGLMLSALVLAWREFGRPRAPQVGFLERKGAIKNFLIQRWFLDRFYRRLLNGLIYRGLADPLTRNDRQVIDGGLEALARLTLVASRAAALLQSGRMRYNLFTALAVLVLAGFYFFLA